MSVVGSSGQINGTAWGPLAFRCELVSSDIQMQVDRRYMVNSSVLTRLTMPEGGKLGDRIVISEEGGGGWRVVQGVDHQIRVGDVLTTAGITGRIDSTALGDTIELVCVDGGFWTATIHSGTVEVN